MGVFKLPGIASTDRTTTVLSQRELVFDTNNNQVYAGDGTTSGGNPLMTNFNLSAGTASGNLSNVVFSNSNGVSFGLSGSTITASVGGGAGDGLNRIVAGTQTAGTLATVVFSNSNGITFGMSNSSVVTASHNGLTTAMQSDAGSLFVNASAAFAGTNASGTIASNGISVSVAAPVTTVGLISAINISAGTTSGNLQAVTFENANGITFGLDAGKVSASHNGLTTARASNDGIGLNTALTANGVSVTANSSGLSLNFPAFLTTAQPVGAYLTTARASNDAVGLNTAATNVTWTVNSSGISLDARNYAGTGTSATNATITMNSNGLAISVANPPAMQSYYDNGVPYQGTTAFTMGASSNFVQPFILPYDISASYIRIANSFAFGSTTGATSANQSLTLNNSQTVWLNIYSKGVGANSKSLQHVTRGSVSFVFQVQVSIGAASNNQTIYHNFTYPNSEGAAQGNYATNYNVNSTNYNISTTHLTSFNGFRWLDIPFATSLSAGDYWMGIAQSTATATTGAVAAMQNVTARNTFVAVSQVNTNIALMGVSSNMSTAPMRNGLGYWSTNANGSSSSSMGLASISSVANQPILPFQIIREA